MTQFVVLFQSDVLIYLCCQQAIAMTAHAIEHLRAQTQDAIVKRGIRMGPAIFDAVCHSTNKYKSVAKN